MSVKPPRKGGRKPKPEGEKQRHVVSVRLTDAELERLTNEANKFKRSLGEVLRIVWSKQNYTTKLLVPPTPERVRQIAQLAGMANDLNLLTKQGGHSDNISQGLLAVLRQMHALLKQLNAGAI